MKPKTGRLEDEYAWATECQLATLSGLCWKRSSPKCEITRQRNIAFHMLKICQEHAGNITWERGPWNKDYSRVRDILDDGDSLYEALNRFTLKGFDKAGDAAKWLASFEKSKKGVKPI